MTTSAKGPNTEPVALTVVPSPAHFDPTHPEHPRRLDGLAESAEEVFGETILRIGSSAASDEAVLAVHDAEYIDFLQRACLQAPAIIDYAPTYVTSESLACAREAAGATLAILDAVLDGRASAGFAAVRPPGHHAPADRAMGFCLLNNIAIAARAAQRSGCVRVMIFDFDVHHGNGTQAIFESDPSVLYVSSHQAGIYPGTGSADEVGTGPGRGATVNIPLPAGAGDRAFGQIASDLLSPLAGRFQPDVILVSAGFDAHWRDPLAGLQATTSGFGRLAADLVSLANRHAQGKIVFVLEGGYDPSAVQEGILACIAAPIGQPPPIDRLGSPARAESDARPPINFLRTLHNL